jgi:hypothetical protein
MSDQLSGGARSRDRRQAYRNRARTVPSLRPDADIDRDGQDGSAAPAGALAD